jgi:hypothetical protein
MRLLKKIRMRNTGMILGIDVIGERMEGKIIKDARESAPMERGGTRKRRVLYSGPPLKGSWGCAAN